MLVSVPCELYRVCMPCHSQLIALALCRWAQVQYLVDDKSLLFHASDVQSKAGKVIKYVTQYGSEVHQKLSDAGLAPTLYEVVQLPGGFMQVSLTLIILLPACDDCNVIVRDLIALGHVCCDNCCRWRWSCLLRRMDGWYYHLFHQKICRW